MATERDAAIRERAYHLWVEGGRRDGTSVQDWLRAEQDHGEASTAASSRSTAAPAAAGRSKSSAPAKRAAKPAREAEAAKPTPASRPGRKPERPVASTETGR